eukprot:TRINITY_DN26551_c0_g1_i1.p1 TRINITY_DN26551_c0_g1~~TRINITY_DN26551_c0_g1_i1.p1  ORF type:complete len:689 (-),score=125.82 TRINITY_DN26551_c0_g1_i1:410-2407(-)
MAPVGVGGKLSCNVEAPLSPPFPASASLSLSLDVDAIMSKPSVGLLSSEDDYADAQLGTCHALEQVISAAVGSLSKAGVGLQRGLMDTAVEVSLETRLRNEDADMARAGHSLYDACSGLGVALVSLAASLSGDVLTPIQDMHRSVDADRAERRNTLKKLREQEMLCSSALTESLNRRDNARAGLQGAMRKRDKKNLQVECAVDKRKSLGGWLRGGRRGVNEADTLPSELNIQRAANVQALSIEELAVRTDEAAIARRKAEEGAKAFSETLRHVDVARKSLLRSSLSRCAGAWDETADVLRQTAQHFRDNVQGLLRAADVQPTFYRTTSSATGLPSARQRHSVGVSTDPVDGVSGGVSAAVHHGQVACSAFGVAASVGKAAEAGASLVADVDGNIDDKSDMSAALQDVLPSGAATITGDALRDNGFGSATIADPHVATVTSVEEAATPNLLNGIIAPENQRFGFYKETIQAETPHGRNGIHDMLAVATTKAAVAEKAVEDVPVMMAAEMLTTDARGAWSLADVACLAGDGGADESESESPFSAPSVPCSQSPSAFASRQVAAKRAACGACAPRNFWTDSLGACDSSLASSPLASDRLTGCLEASSLEWRPFGNPFEDGDDSHEGSVLCEVTDPGCDGSVFAKCEVSRTSMSAPLRDSMRRLVDSPR